MFIHILKIYLHIFIVICYVDKLITWSVFPFLVKNININWNMYEILRLIKINAYNFKKWYISSSYVMNFWERIQKHFQKIETNILMGTRHYMFDKKIFAKISKWN